MLLRFDNGHPYATGFAPYVYRPVTNRESIPRIILTVLIEDFETSAFVDTGGIFLISPDVAQHAGLNPEDGISAPYPLHWRNYRLQGVLHRVTLTLPVWKGIA